MLLACANGDQCLGGNDSNKRNRHGYDRTSLPKPITGTRSVINMWLLLLHNWLTQRTSLTYIACKCLLKTEQCPQPNYIQTGAF